MVQFYLFTAINTHTNNGIATKSNLFRDRFSLSDDLTDNPFPFRISNQLLLERLLKYLFDLAKLFFFLDSIFLGKESAVIKTVGQQSVEASKNITNSKSTIS